MNKGRAKFQVRCCLPQCFEVVLVPRWVCVHTCHSFRLACETSYWKKKVLDLLKLAWLTALLKSVKHSTEDVQLLMSLFDRAGVRCLCKTHSQIYVFLQPEYVNYHLLANFDASSHGSFNIYIFPWHQNVAGLKEKRDEYEAEFMLCSSEGNRSSSS